MFISKPRKVTLTLVCLAIALAFATVSEASDLTLQRRDHVDLRRMIKKRASSDPVLGLFTDGNGSGGSSTASDSNTAAATTASSAAADTSSAAATTSASAQTSSDAATTSSSSAAATTQSSSSAAAATTSATTPSTSAAATPSTSAPSATTSAQSQAASTSGANTATTARTTNANNAATSPAASATQDTQGSTDSADDQLTGTATTSTIFTTPSSSASSDATSSGTSKTTRNTIIIIIVIASVVGSVSIGWTLFRKWKLRPSSSFDERMQPIDWQPTSDDSVNKRASHGSFHSGTGHGDLGGYGLSDSGHGTSNLQPVPDHDFTAGASLAPVGGYADLQRCPSPQPQMGELARGLSMSRPSDLSRNPSMMHQNYDGYAMPPPPVHYHGGGYDASAYGYQNHIGAPGY
ncbi:uncharacterized protein LAESUDRAFT_762759 [Laetiporus sulphureus 93-53]|uniref:Mid2 domain-containing protein n=1 Tax=Laetiporus sulphureus 93-53 TaxID=1314785 RepID=A0A165C939_9APHY|nr:uncharacterized protein LAESUDRAFT_762759 [Laetiporus sulphureus 93-53]KZT02412.1 hypothetical protein LAESUDRAFT_762759 [Laetiporus sulphureus 93-53]